MAGKTGRKMLGAGDKAPAFSLRAIDGTLYRLESMLEQGPVLLAFFKVSCPTCQFTFPFLERLRGNDAFSLYGISQDPADAAREFLDAFGVRFPTLLDPAQSQYPASNGFGISIVPSVFLVESDGTIAQAFNGFSRDDLEALAARAARPVFHPGEAVPAYRPG